MKQNNEKPIKAVPPDWDKNPRRLGQAKQNWFNFSAFFMNKASHIKCMGELPVNGLTPFLYFEVGFLGFITASFKFLLRPAQSSKCLKRIPFRQ